MAVVVVDRYMDAGKIRLRRLQHSKFSRRTCLTTSDMRGAPHEILRYSHTDGVAATETRNWASNATNSVTV